MIRISTLSVFWLLARCVADKPEIGLLIHNSFSPYRRTDIDIKSHIYSDLVYNSDLTVDKTLLIRAIMKHRSNLFIITCPHQWGKTVNMYMIKEFFQTEKPSDENEIMPLHLKNNYYFYLKGEIKGKKNVRQLTKPPLLSKHKFFIKHYMGRYPVIYLNMANITWKHFTPATKELQYLIGSAFRNAMYSISVYKRIIDDDHSDNITKEDARQKFYKFTKYMYKDTQIEDNVLIESLQFLSETLYKYFNQKVLVLIDDYFHPWKKVFTKMHYTVGKKAEFINFYSKFMAATVKTNPYLKKAILTAVQPPPEELRQYALSNATECNLLTGTFMEYYGFNQWEMERIINTTVTSAFIQQEINLWYKGYKINDRDLLIYNPLCINKVIQDKTFDKYWINSGTLQYLIKNFIKVHSFNEKFRSLAQKKSITIHMKSQHFTWNDYIFLMKATGNQIDVGDEFTDKAFMYLFTAGYLTLCENATKTSNGTIYRLKFPNMEVNFALKSYVS